MKSITRTMTGLLFVVVGTSLLLTTLNILPFSVRISDWWPLFIIAGGVLIVLNDAKNYLWALLAIILGVALQLKQLELISINPWQLIWPAILIVIGLSILMNRTAKKMTPTTKEREDITAILGGNETHIQSKDFRGSKVTAVLGGAVIDLSDALIRKEATIDLFTFWGGIEIRVPKGIEVRNNTSVILGGVEDSSAGGRVESGPVLHIIGDVIMAGVEVKRIK